MCIPTLCLLKGIAYSRLGLLTSINEHNSPQSPWVQTFVPLGVSCAFSSVLLLLSICFVLFWLVWFGLVLTYIISP